jgi:hypothetical protein
MTERQNIAQVARGATSLHRWEQPDADLQLQPAGTVVNRAASASTALL